MSDLIWTVNMKLIRTMRFTYIPGRGEGPQYSFNIKNSSRTKEKKKYKKCMTGTKCNKEYNITQHKGTERERGQAEALGLLIYLCYVNANAM